MSVAGLSVVNLSICCSGLRNSKRDCKEFQRNDYKQPIYSFAFLVKDALKDLIELSLELDYLILALLFGRGKGLIGSFHKCMEILVGIKSGDACAHGHFEELSAGFVGHFRKSGDQAFAHFHGIVNRETIIKHGNFVATDTADYVCVSVDLFDDLHQGDDGPVADGEAIGLVDMLQIINVVNGQNLGEALGPGPATALVG